MATTFTLTGALRLVSSWQDDLTLTTVTDAATVQRTLSIASGTGAGQADGYWRDVRTVATSATDTIDTTALPLSVFGTSGTLNLATVKLIYVRNQSATVTLTYDIGGTSCDLPPGAIFLWTAGTGATNPWFASGDIVIEGGAASADYEIVLVGVQA
jgi:hypothetical protein